MSNQNSIFLLIYHEWIQNDPITIVTMLRVCYVNVLIWVNNNKTIVADFVSGRILVNVWISELMAIIYSDKRLFTQIFLQEKCNKYALSRILSLSWCIHTNCFSTVDSTNFTQPKWRKTARTGISLKKHMFSEYCTRIVSIAAECFYFIS